MVFLWPHELPLFELCQTKVAVPLRSPADSGGRESGRSAAFNVHSGNSSAGGDAIIGAQAALIHAARIHALTWFDMV